MNDVVIMITGPENDNVVLDEFGDDVLVYCYIGAGRDKFIGTGNQDVVLTTAEALGAEDEFDGRGGNDILVIEAAGAELRADALTNVKSFEHIVSVSGGAITFLQAGWNERDHVFGLGSSADDRFDAAGVTWNFVSHSGSGHDQLLGGAGDDRFVFGPGDLDADDIVSGGAGFDYLDLLPGVTLDADALAGVRTLEAVIVRGGVTILLTEGITGKDDLLVQAAAGRNVIDGAALDTTRLVVVSEGGDRVVGGNRNDALFLSASSQAVAFDGGDGFDQIVFPGGVIDEGAFDQIRNVEYLVLSAPSSLVVSQDVSSRSFLYVIGSTGADVIDGRSVTDIDLSIHGAGGRDRLLGGDGNDSFVVPDVTFEFASGGAGYDTLFLTGPSVALDWSDLAPKLDGIEAINLDFCSGARVTIDLGAFAPASHLSIFADSDDVLVFGSKVTIASSERLGPAAFRTVLTDSASGATVEVVGDAAIDLGAGQNSPPRITATSGLITDLSAGDTPLEGIGLSVVEPDGDSISAILLALSDAEALLVDDILSGAYPDSSASLDLSAAALSLLGGLGLTITQRTDRELLITGFADASAVSDILKGVIFDAADSETFLHVIVTDSMGNSSLPLALMLVSAPDVLLT